VAVSSKDDISGLMRRWPFDPDNYLRRIIGADGRPKLQVRFPMGLEQYELDGRPDGLRPMDCESYLDYYQQLRDATVATSGKQNSFGLTPGDCERLRLEADIYHYRLGLLFRERDYERAAADAARNLRAFDFVAQCAERAEDCDLFDRHRAYTVRVLAVSRAMIWLRRGAYEEAYRHVRQGILQLEQMASHLDDRNRRQWRQSLTRLRRLARHIQRNKPLTPRQRLQRDLKAAVDREDYESAARLRDQLAAMPQMPAETPPPGPPKVS
jgi:hypothetical protein